MDLAALYDFVIEKGSTFERVVRWEDASGAARDISSYTIGMTIKSFPSNDVIASTLGTSPKIVIVNSESLTGVFTITITAANTALLDFDTAVYTIDATNGSTIYRLMQGKVTLDAGI